MTMQELEARACAKAIELHTHVMAVPGREGVYHVSSASERGTKYVVVSKAGVQACSCKGFEYRRSCRHLEALRNRLAREATRPVRKNDLYPA